MTDSNQSKNNQEEVKTETQKVEVVKTETEQEADKNNTNDSKNADVKLDEKIENEKIVSALAYIIFFLPLLAIPTSKFGKFHANQGLILFLAVIINTIVSTLLFWTLIIPLLSFFVSITLLIFAIIGFINALNGKANKLPLIGGFNLLQ